MAMPRGQVGAAGGQGSPRAPRGRPSPSSCPRDGGGPQTWPGGRIDSAHAVRRLGWRPREGSSSSSPPRRALAQGYLPLRAALALQVALRFTGSGAGMRGRALLLDSLCQGNRRVASAGSVGASAALLLCHRRPASRRRVKALSEAQASGTRVPKPLGHHCVFPG